MNLKATVVSSIKFKPCRGNFLHKLKNINDLPQYKDFIDLMSNNNTVALIVNHDYCSLEELNKKIIETVNAVTVDYFYLAINKFLIYSNTDLDLLDKNWTCTDNWDNLLIDYCASLIKDQFDLIKFTVRNDDDGYLGNFIHPVTTMIFKKHD